MWLKLTFGFYTMGPPLFCMEKVWGAAGYQLEPHAVLLKWNWGFNKLNYNKTSPASQNPLPSPPFLLPFFFFNTLLVVLKPVFNISIQTLFDLKAF